LDSFFTDIEMMMLNTVSTRDFETKSKILGFSDNFVIGVGLQLLSQLR